MSRYEIITRPDGIQTRRPVYTPGERGYDKHEWSYVETVDNLTRVAASDRARAERLLIEAREILLAARRLMPVDAGQAHALLQSAAWARRGAQSALIGASKYARRAAALALVAAGEVA